jgi:hypothetical protein
VFQASRLRRLGAVYRLFEASVHRSDEPSTGNTSNS